MGTTNGHQRGTDPATSGAFFMATDNEISRRATVSLCKARIMTQFDRNHLSGSAASIVVPPRRGAAGMGPARWRGWGHGAALRQRCDLSVPATGTGRDLGRRRDDGGRATICWRREVDQLDRARCLPASSPESPTTSRRSPVRSSSLRPSLRALSWLRSAEARPDQREVHSDVR